MDLDEFCHWCLMSRDGMNVLTCILTSLPMELLFVAWMLRKSSWNSASLLS